MINEEKVAAVDSAGVGPEIDETNIERLSPIAFDAYREDAIDHLVWLDRAIFVSDTEEIAEVIHAMRSAALAIEAYPLAELLEQLETAARSDNLTTARTLLQPMLSERAEVLTSLRRAATIDSQICPTPARPAAISDST